MIRGSLSFDVKIFFIRSDTILTVNCNFAFIFLAMFFLGNPKSAHSSFDFGMPVGFDEIILLYPVHVTTRKSLGI